MPFCLDVAKETLERDGRFRLMKSIKLGAFAQGKRLRIVREFSHDSLTQESPKCERLGTCSQVRKVAYARNQI